MSRNLVGYWKNDKNHKFYFWPNFTTKKDKDGIGNEKTANDLHKKVRAVHGNKVAGGFYHGGNSYNITVRQKHAHDVAKTIAKHNKGGSWDGRLHEVW